MFCVLETQVHKTRVEGLKHTLGFDNSFAVSSSGRSGGLGIFWNNNTSVTLLPYSEYHIVVWVLVVILAIVTLHCPLPRKVVR